ncbi:MAG: hypothetical protein JO266_20505 [Acidobacteria bacterium]|nr:hypothetical protein [Acidobacteriota bacterium]
MYRPEDHEEACQRARYWLSLLLLLQHRRSLSPESLEAEAVTLMLLDRTKHLRN